MSALLRIPLLLAVYAALAAVCLWLAWELRFGFYGIEGIPELFREKLALQFSYIVPFKCVCLFVFGQFNGMIRFFRMPDAVRLFLASALATATLLAIWVVSSIQFVPPGSVLLVDFILFTFAVMGLRAGIRLIDERRKGLFNTGRKMEKVAIVGAGQSGSSLAGQLLSSPELGMRPIAFFDDSSQAKGRSLHGIPVLGEPEAIPSYFADHMIEKVILAFSKTNPNRTRKIVSFLTREGIPVEIIPSVDGLFAGKGEYAVTREVHIEDLLYREPVEIDHQAMRSHVEGKCVLVTGAGGSIGQELVMQLAALGPARLLIMDRNEGALFITEKELQDSELAVPTEVLVADVRDLAVMNSIFEAHRPDLVYHAAAHKHVGMMERQPREAFLNNTMGTLDLARLAQSKGVQSFCLISTDKAVEPSNVMGATKRLAELGVQALANVEPSGVTNFTIVRFGNVIGSSGSVIPIFEKQIEARRSVTVTDPGMTRYFMTIPEAVGLVLQADAFEEPNRLYSLDMGVPVSIDSMARDLIRLKGLEPDVDIPVVYTGIRPGEKLKEALVYPEEELMPTGHPKVFRMTDKGVAVEETADFLIRLEQRALELREGSLDDQRRQLFELLEHEHYSSIYKYQPSDLPK